MVKRLAGHGRDRMSAALIYFYRAHCMHVCTERVFCRRLGFCFFAVKVLHPNHVAIVE